MCWMCENIKNGGYTLESSNKKTRLTIYREKNENYIMRVWGEDVLEQEINYCPMCGRKLGD